MGVVAVPDERLPVLSGLNKSVATIYTSVEFVDIAGLVKGASKGEGLGNKFLATIRECDSIVQVGDHLSGTIWCPEHAFIAANLGVRLG